MYPLGAGSTLPHSPWNLCPQTWSRKMFPELPRPAASCHAMPLLKLCSAQSPCMVSSLLPLTSHWPAHCFICFSAHCLFSFLRLFFFLMWTIFKVFIAFITILLLFYVLIFWLRGMWDLNPPTRDRTRTHCIGRRSPNHWTAREVPSSLFKKKKKYVWRYKYTQSSAQFSRQTLTHVYS